MEHTHVKRYPQINTRRTPQYTHEHTTTCCIYMSESTCKAVCAWHLPAEHMQACSLTFIPQAHRHDRKRKLWKGFWQKRGLRLPWELPAAGIWFPLPPPGLARALWLGCRITAHWLVPTTLPAQFPHLQSVFSLPCSKAGMRIKWENRGPNVGLTKKTDLSFLPWQWDLLLRNEIFSSGPGERAAWWSVVKERCFCWSQAGKYWQERELRNFHKLTLKKMKVVSFITFFIL